MIYTARCRTCGFWVKGFHASDLRLARLDLQKEMQKHLQDKHKHEFANSNSLPLGYYKLFFTAIAYETDPFFSTSESAKTLLQFMHNRPKITIQ